MSDCPDFDFESAWVEDAKKASAKWNRSQAVGAFIAEYSERHRFEDRYYRMMDCNMALGVKIRSLKKRIRQLENGGSK